MDDENPSDVETRSGVPSERVSTEDFSEDVLELDHVFQALAESRRRYLVYTLKSQTEWELTEIAVKVASWETDIPEGDLPEEDIERTYASLYHAHVPKLVDEGVLAFDEANEIIRPGPNAEQVVAALAGAGASLDARQEAHARREMDDTNE
ncbi:MULTISPECIES: hypothetical protein [unclassified Haladaptatus]|uniref:DUF7344 domain-containing protein n=1 Tax=unclassified Haladaptatus TaxID=2622732 RepID=UPI00209C4B4F|nr:MULTISPECIES: hypothetical protein [unclassified Haladaptatus]MCO8245171.1 hypothetical protein [Haladaptatus sp. AB643]MCO8253315.1 hypothetical protein [Haladaptatus sp. AB618]